MHKYRGVEPRTKSTWVYNVNVCKAKARRTFGVLLFIYIDNKK